MDVFDLYAKISLDTKDYDKGLEDAGDKASVFGDILSANLVTKGISLVVDGLKKIAEVAVDVMEQSINSYAEYEQLIGGTSLVFGDAYDYIMEKASQAYATVQMSANEYLQQVNGLAVGLKESLGGNEQAAAQLADRIVQAEADVVAAMGITQEAAQNAFNGIMKGNYTMVDNLGLGIKATKEGIEDMIAKVNDWNAAQGRSTQYTIDNVADIQQALVDYIDMQGLAGYAANEAKDTISGSAAGMKAAWSNLLTGLSDDTADMDKLIADFVESADQYLDNLIPVAEKAFDGLIEVGLQMLPEFAELGIRIVEAIAKGILSIPFRLIGALLQSFGVGEDESKSQAARFAGKRAAGGFISAGSMYLVGEEGPEVITATQNGYVHNARETADMLGGGVVNNFYIQGDIYDDERSMKKKFETAILDVLESQVAYG